MRLQPLHFAALAALALALAFPAFTHAQYGGPPSDYDRQRRLESEGQKFRDALRSQRNTPSPRSNSESTSDWLNRMQAANEARKQTRSQADSDRRAAQRYANSEAGREAAANARYQRALQIIAEEKAALAAQARKQQALRAARALAVEAEKLARSERIGREDQKRWEAENHHFIPRHRVGSFSNPGVALQWYLAHDRESPNPWAAGHAAILLIDGYGVDADPAAAALLLNPRTRREPTGEQPRPELAALFAYLRARHPETCVPLGFPADPAAARRDLEALALIPHNDIARWYLARILSESPDPADQKQAFHLLPEGYAWMIKHPAGLLQNDNGGRLLVRRYLDATAAAILTRAADQLPEALVTWPLEKISAITGLVTHLPEPQLDNALRFFANFAAEQYLTKSPSPDFPYSEFEDLLVAAAQRGSSAAHAIALFERLHLIRFDEDGRNPPFFLQLDFFARPLPSLSRWAQRSDALGVRARLALAALAFEMKNPSPPNTPVVLPESFASVTDTINRYRAVGADAARYPSLYATDDAALNIARESVYAAIARRDATAPLVSDVPSLLDGLVLFHREQDQMYQLNEAGGLYIPTDRALFAINAASFDLDRAADHFDIGNAPDMIDVDTDSQRAAKLHALFEATRLGDAFAPRLLSQDPDFDFHFTPAARAKLRTLSDGRRARDEAARRPRALTVRIIEACLNSTDPDPAFVSIAAANGSRIATHVQFDQRLEASLRSGSDAPPSARVAPTLREEFDATLLALGTQPPAATAPELQFLRLVMTRASDLRPVNAWFPYVNRWAQDRNERLLQALRPSFEALVVTLGEWPGLNHEDPRHEDWLNEIAQVYEKAEALIATDGLEALTLCLEAAGRGNRDALTLLASHLRHGLDTFPPAPEFADLLLAASLKIARADAEVGDASAARALGLALLEGDGIAKDPTAGREWLRYSAQLGNHDAAYELRNLAGREGDAQPGDPAAESHWTSVGILIRAGQCLPVPPRRLGSDVLELDPILPALEAALTTAHANLPALKAKRVTEEESDAAYALHTVAYSEARYRPATGIVSLAQLASTGNKIAAFTTAQFLAGGLSGLRPDQPLARRFHALALELQQTNAEFGNERDACHLGLHHLELAEKTEPAAAIRWLTYAAELGHHDAATRLQTLYTTGAPGIPADAKAAAHWNAFGERIGTETFKPRAPLR